MAVSTGPLIAAISWFLQSHPLAAFWAFCPLCFWIFIWKTVADASAYWSLFIQLPMMTAFIFRLASFGFRASRLWALFIDLFAGSVALLVAAEFYRKKYIRDAAEALNAMDVVRSSLLWSFANVPADFQFGLHAQAIIECESFVWSYSEMDWYRIPSIVCANESARNTCSYNHLRPPPWRRPNGSRLMRRRDQGS